MAFNVNQFRSQLQGDGARPNLFEVSMPFPAFSLPGNAQTKMTFMCKTAQLPGATIGIAIYKMAAVKQAHMLFERWRQELRGQFQTFVH